MTFKMPRARRSARSARLSRFTCLTGLTLLCNLCILLKQQGFLQAFRLCGRRSMPETGRFGRMHPQWQHRAKQHDDENVQTVQDDQNDQNGELEETAQNESEEFHVDDVSNGTGTNRSSSLGNVTTKDSKAKALRSQRLTQRAPSPRPALEFLKEFKDFKDLKDGELLDILRNAPRSMDARVKTAAILRCLSTADPNRTGAEGTISCENALDFTPLHSTLDAAFIFFGMGFDVSLQRLEFLWKGDGYQRPSFPFIIFIFSIRDALENL